MTDLPVRWGDQEFLEMEGILVMAGWFGNGAVDTSLTTMGLELVSLSHFLYDFWSKIFLLVY